MPAAQTKPKSDGNLEVILRADLERVLARNSCTIRHSHSQNGRGERGNEARFPTSTHPSRQRMYINSVLPRSIAIMSFTT